MKQVRIEPVSKLKFRIYLDGEFAFILYKSELSSCKIRDGQTISDEEVTEILSETVLKRAKQKAMSLLQSADRTKKELESRLLQQEFPEMIVRQAIRYVESYGYINDRRYAENFILSRKDRKSRKEIYAELCRKQIDHGIVDEMMEQCYEKTDSMEAILRILRKKRYDAERADDAEKRKIYSYLARKGFAYGEIKKAMELDPQED